MSDPAPAPPLPRRLLCSRFSRPHPRRALPQRRELRLELIGGELHILSITFCSTWSTVVQQLNRWIMETGAI